MPAQPSPPKPSPSPSPSPPQQQSSFTEWPSVPKPQPERKQAPERKKSFTFDQVCQLWNACLLCPSECFLSASARSLQCTCDPTRCTATTLCMAGYGFRGSGSRDNQRTMRDAWCVLYGCVIQQGAVLSPATVLNHVCSCVGIAWYRQQRGLAAFLVQDRGSSTALLCFLCCVGHSCFTQHSCQLHSRGVAPVAAEQRDKELNSIVRHQPTLQVSCLPSMLRHPRGSLCLLRS